MPFETLSVATILITFGGLFLAGLAADLLGRHTILPRVTLLLLTGFALGPSILDWLPDFLYNWFPILTDIALAMIGFLLGQNLTLDKLRKQGKVILVLSITVTITTVVVVFSGLSLIGVPFVLALLLAGLATPTDPAAVVDVVEENKASGPFTDTLLGIVAIDDAWGLLLFSLLLMVASIIAGEGSGNVTLIIEGLWELAGAILLGVALGGLMAFLTGHLYPGKSTQAETLGMVLLCAGLAEWLEVSYILSCMVMGAWVANFTHHHRHRPFEEVRSYEWPLLILFFLLAGASLQVETLMTTGFIGIAFILLRIGGRWLGIKLGSQVVDFPSNHHSPMAWSLLPQAGLAIGMALIALHLFPAYTDVILPVILSATIFFEIIGPILVRVSLKITKETGKSV